MKKKFFFFCLFFVLLEIWQNKTLAEKQQLTAAYYPVIDKEVAVGDILAKSQDGLKKASAPCDPNIFGVVIEEAMVIFHKKTPDSFLVATEGEVPVKVTNKNGEIKRGDFITSSDVAGIGQKMNQSGTALGTALEDFNEKEGTILVGLNVQHVSLPGAGAKPRLSDFFQLMTKHLERPENFPLVLRYIFAILLAAVSFFFGFSFAVRTMQKGVEAIGRNPLAKRSIQAAIVLNLIGVAFLSLAGLIVALIVILY